MNIQLITQSLKTKYLGQNKIHFEPEIDSTQAFAGRQKDLKKGDVFITDFQTQGYGRLKRNWESPPAKNILMTFVDEIPLNAAHLPQLTLVCGVAMALALRALNVPITLKWPNDLFVGKKKLGGILCEADQGLVRIGVGLNINTTPSEYSEEIRAKTTSVFRELGQTSSREQIIASCLNVYETKREQLDLQGVAKLIQEWETLTLAQGTPIRIIDDKQTFEAKYWGVTPDGFLRAQVGDTVKTFMTGDLILV